VITTHWAEGSFAFELLPAVRGPGIGGLAMQG
jgi:hypothetical protein